MFELNRKSNRDFPGSSISVHPATTPKAEMNMLTTVILEEKMIPITAIQKSVSQK